MPPTAWTRVKATLSIFAVSVGISLFATTYEKAVNPLFGSTATAKYLDHVVHGSTILGIILSNILPRSLLLPSLAVLVLVAPHTSYWVSVFAARSRDPIFGPLVTHAVVLAPVIYFAVSLAMSVDSTFAIIALAANALQLRPFVLLGAHRLSFVAYKDTVFHALGSLALFIWSLERINTSQVPAYGRASLFNAIRRLWPIAIPLVFLLFSFTFPPTLSGSGIFPYQRQDHPLRILSSKDSVTGIVVVGELLPKTEVTDPAAIHSIRYLRASHSLLGGVWIGSNVASLDGISSRTDQMGVALGDSIYNTFVLQEAVRLAHNSLQDNADQNALIIGLGAGISADAFIRHDIPVTIVEIDPAVYDAARTYFGLKVSGDDHIFLEDARNWVSKRRVASQSCDKKNHPAFDIVVHDCFSGGGVPQHLFSVEFWSDLKSIMTPDGVVAVNFAGRFGSHSTRAVVTTLLRVFGQCRVFHDLSTLIPMDQSYTDFLNMVFFCSLSSQPLTFRRAVDADYLHSYLRRYVLSSLDQREVSISQLKGGRTWSKDTEAHFVLTDMNNTLNAWQSEEAVEHWKLMRHVLPDILWETY